VTVTAAETTAPEPLDVELPQATGEPEVDAALGRLPEAAGLPTPAHAAVYEDVHRRLRFTLAALDE
jgi:hypothetical protein